MLTNTVGRVVQGFDRSALPYVRSLFSSAQRSQRRPMRPRSHSQLPSSGRSAEWWS
jgi:hypothetical protein